MISSPKYQMKKTKPDEPKASPSTKAKAKPIPKPKPVPKPSTTARNEVIAQAVTKLQTIGERDTYHISPERLEWALDRLACGDQMVNVCRELQVSRACLWIKARADADFNVKLRDAVATGSRALRDIGLDAVMGGEMSTGSIERDKLIWNALTWIMARESRNDYGDRIQVDQRTIVMNVVAKDETDW